MIYHSFSFILIFPIVLYIKFFNIKECLENKKFWQITKDAEITTFE